MKTCSHARMRDGEQAVRECGLLRTVCGLHHGTVLLSRIASALLGGTSAGRRQARGRDARHTGSGDGGSVNGTVGNPPQRRCDRSARCVALSWKALAKACGHRHLS